MGLYVFLFLKGTEPMSKLAARIKELGLIIRWDSDEQEWVVQDAKNFKILGTTQDALSFIEGFELAKNGIFLKGTEPMSKVIESAPWHPQEKPEYTSRMDAVEKKLARLTDVEERLQDLDTRVRELEYP